MRRREWLRLAATIGAAMETSRLRPAALAGPEFLDHPDVPDGPDDDPSPMPPASPRVAPIVAIEGDGGRVLAVAISPDGSRIVSAEEGRVSFKVCDAARGQERATSPAHPGPLLSLAFAPDGVHVASASATADPEPGGGPGRPPEGGPAGLSSVRISNASSGRLVRDVGGFRGVTLALAMARGDSAVALGSDDLVHRWQGAVLQESFAPEGLGSRARGVRFGPAQSGFGVDVEGRRAASLNVGAQIEKFDRPEDFFSLWDAEAGTRRFLDADAGPLRSVAISPDGSRVLVGSAHQQILCFDFETGRRVFGFSPGPMMGGEGPYLLAYSPDGSRFVLGKKDGILRMHEAGAGRHVDSSRGPKAFIRAVAFLSDRLRVVSGGMAEARFKGVPAGGEPKRFEPLWVWDLVYLRMPGRMESFRPPRR
jgi:WD40 repeat protein